MTDHEPTESEPPSAEQLMAMRRVLSAPLTIDADTRARHIGAALAAYDEATRHSRSPATGRDLSARPFAASSQRVLAGLGAAAVVILIVGLVGFGVVQSMGSEDAADRAESVAASDSGSPQSASPDSPNPESDSSGTASGPAGALDSVATERATAAPTYSDLGVVSSRDEIVDLIRPQSIATTAPPEAPTANDVESSDAVEGSDPALSDTLAVEIERCSAAVNQLGPDRYLLRLDDDRFLAANPMASDDNALLVNLTTCSVESVELRLPSG